MYNDKELANLIDMAGRRVLDNGWVIVIRADWTDVTPQQPHGLDYAIILLDEKGNRLLGFDNSHASDGASDGDSWDHEHRPGLTAKRFPYKFSTASALISDFFERVQKYADARGIELSYPKDSVK
jgi:hypothetical protein